MKNLLGLICTGILMSCNGNVETYSLKYSVSVNDSCMVEARDIVTDMQYILLDSLPDIVENGIQKFDVVNDRIYCLSKSLKRVCVFAMNGDYLFCISNSNPDSDANEQFSSMFVNEQDNVVILTSCKNEKVLLYDMDGNFIKTISLPNSNCVETAYSHHYIYSATHSSNSQRRLDDRSKYKMYIYDENGGIVGRYVEDGINDHAAMPPIPYSIVKGEESILFVPVLNPTVYAVREEKIKPYINFSSGLGHPLFYANEKERCAFCNNEYYGNDYVLPFSNSIVESPDYVIRRLSTKPVVDVIFCKKCNTSIVTSFSPNSKENNAGQEREAIPLPDLYYKDWFYALYPIGIAPNNLGFFLPNSENGTYSNIIIRYKVKQPACISN